MKKQHFFISLIALFNLLFWQEQLGINLLLFWVVMAGGMYFLNKESWETPVVKWMTFASGWLALMVVFQNSLFVKWAFFIVNMTWLGFIHEKHLRFPGFAFLQALSGSVGIINQIIEKRESQQSQLRVYLHSFSRNLKLTMVPVAGLFTFHWMYRFANHNFDRMAGQFWDGVWDAFSFEFNLLRWLFFLLSIIVGSIIVFKAKNTGMLWWEHQQEETIRSLRKPLKKAGLWMGLKRKFQSGVLLLAALNALLCIVNFTDIWYVWMGNDTMSPALLKEYVHQATYVLIFAILMAMGILLYYFKNRLNFFSKNKSLKWLAYAWIVQNLLLAISVGIRNYHYIDHCGLAYKRIGVVLFLSLTIYGLWTLFIKVRDQKTIYFLLHRNVWALVILLVVAGSVNWDIAITRYNLFVPTKNGLDASFLISEVSDKNTYLLVEHKDLIAQKVAPDSRKGILKSIEVKESIFIRKTTKQGWLSWNYADYRNRKALEIVR